MTSIRIFLAMLAALALCGIGPVGSRHRAVPVAAHTVTPLLPAEQVLERYQEQLAQTSPPPALIFDYTIEQVGPHDIEQVHHVYRQSTTERDEIVAIDGNRLGRPSVTISARRTDRYDITSVAPRTSQYDFTFIRLAPSGDHFDYVFRTDTRTTAAFNVVDLTIEGDSFLPSIIDFRSTNADGKAFGRLSYGHVDDHWLIHDATVSASVDGKPVREHLSWINYEFPLSLPASTFSGWRAAPLDSATPLTARAF
ncbi:MAG TPA: hypothetical protein VGD50_00980 [Candidatus Baltobacteraceae bacterium]